MLDASQHRQKAGFSFMPSILHVGKTPSYGVVDVSCTQTTPGCIVRTRGESPAQLYNQVANHSLDFF